jgi:hypothetical protein
MTPRQQSIFVGAVVTGVLSASYFSFLNALCCLGVIIGGLVAVQQYASRTGAAVEAGDGAVIGALAGAGGAVIGSLLDRVLRPLGLDSRTISQDFMQGMMDGMEGQQGMPQMLEQMQQDGGGGAMMFLFGLVFSLVLYAIFGAIGGAIGSSLFGPDEAAGGAQPGAAGTGPQAGAAPDAGSSPGTPSNREGSV